MAFLRMTSAAAGAAGLCLLAAAATAQTTVALGSYECWSSGSARLGLNFKLLNATTYSDSEDKKGTWRFDGTWITFRGGALDGERVKYLVAKGRPSASFRNDRDREIASCDKV